MLETVEYLVHVGGGRLAPAGLVVRQAGIDVIAVTLQAAGDILAPHDVGLETKHTVIKRVAIFVRQGEG